METDIFLELEKSLDYIKRDFVFIIGLQRKLDYFKINFYSFLQNLFRNCE